MDPKFQRAVTTINLEDNLLGIPGEVAPRDGWRWVKMTKTVYILKSYVIFYI